MSTTLSPAPVSRACQMCEGKKYVLSREGERAVARVCSGCSQSCEVCHGQGHVYVKQEGEFSRRVGLREYEVLAPCSCRLLRRRVEAFSRVSVPGVLATADFASFRAFNGPQDEA